MGGMGKESCHNNYPMGVTGSILWHHSLPLPLPFLVLRLCFPSHAPPLPRLPPPQDYVPYVGPEGGDVLLNFAASPPARPSGVAPAVQLSSARGPPSLLLTWVASGGKRWRGGALASWNLHTHSQ